MKRIAELLEQVLREMRGMRAELRRLGREEGQESCPHCGSASLTDTPVMGESRRLTCGACGRSEVTHG